MTLILKIFGQHDVTSIMMVQIIFLWSPPEILSVSMNSPRDIVSINKLPQGYCQYQWTDSHTVNFRSTWRYIHVTSIMTVQIIFLWSPPGILSVSMNSPRDIVSINELTHTVNFRSTWRYIHYDGTDNFPLISPRDIVSINELPQGYCQYQWSPPGILLVSMNWLSNWKLSVNITINQ
jgi:hypothetical protein